jgi:hypothetical protein
VRIAKRSKVRVPWLELARVPTKYLDVGTLPEDFKVLDPSKLTNDMVNALLNYWAARARAKLPILMFIAARYQDQGCAQHLDLETSRVAGKRKADEYADLSSDNQASDDELEEGHRGNPGSSARQTPPKRRRLFKQPAILVKQSPASNNGDRPKYLYSLSSDRSYKTLLDGVLALPVSVSPFFLHLYQFV